MAGNTGTIKIALQMDDKGSIKVLNRIGSESEKTGKQGKESFDKMDKSARGFSGGADKASAAILKIGASVAGLMAAKMGWDALKSAAAEYVELANVQEAAETDLQAVLRSTGQAAGYNLEQLKSMASGMQDVTRTGDEVILGGMSILATFKRVRGEAFERASMAALDMSRIMKQDVKSSMVQLGKALNDPIQGLTALSRVGVTFTDEQKDMITTLQNSGDMIGAQNIILAELESQFGGAAKAAAQTFAGGMDQAGNALGDVKEELGFVITKNQFFIELTHLATEQFKTWGNEITANRDDLMMLAKNGVLTVVDALGLGIETLRFFHNGWLGIKLVGDAAVHGLAVALDELNPMMRSLMAPLDALFAGLVKIGVLDVNPFDSLAKGLEDFRYSSGSVVAEVEADIAKTNAHYDKIKATVNGWKEKIEEIPVTQVATDEKIIKSSQNATAALVENNESYVQEAVTGRKEIDGVDMEMWRKMEQRGMKAADKAIKNFEREKKEAERTAAAINTAMDRMYQDIGLKGDENYRYQKRLLDKQAENYKTMGVDRDLVERWWTEEHRKLKEQQIRDSDNFIAGVRLGLTDSQRDFSTWAEHGVHVSRDLSSGVVSEFSDVLVTGVTSGIGAMQDRFGQAMDTMLNKLISTVAEMAVQWATTQMISFGSKALDWLSAESGIWDMDPTQIGRMYPDSQGQPGTPTVIHDGEMVVPADVAGNVRHRLSQAGINDFQSLANALSADNPAGIPAGIDDGLSVFGAAFAKNMGIRAASTAASGISLAAGGYDVGVSDVIRASLTPESVMTAALGALTTAINDQLGLRTSTWGKGGQIAGSILGGIGFGQLGKIVGGIIGGYAGMGIGDLTDSRSLESIRDMFEDNSGWFSGQQDFADFVSGMGDAGYTTDGMRGWGGYGGYGIGNPGSYGGSNVAGVGNTGTSDGPSVGNTGGGTPGRDPGGSFGLAAGGVITSVMLPSGEDGWQAVQLGEGVVSKRGMETLDQINQGSMGLDISALVTEIRALRKELGDANIRIIAATQKTAMVTEETLRRAIKV